MERFLTAPPESARQMTLDMGENQESIGFEKKVCNLNRLKMTIARLIGDDVTAVDRPRSERAAQILLSLAVKRAVASESLPFRTAPGIETPSCRIKKADAMFLDPVENVFCLSWGRNCDSPFLPMQLIAERSPGEGVLERFILPGVYPPGCVLRYRTEFRTFRLVLRPMNDSKPNIKPASFISVKVDPQGAT
jgi:hypothetical protein